MAELRDGNSSQSAIKPIAVIGFSARFPEDATSPEKFWEMLIKKSNVSRDFPSDRVNLDAFYHPDSSRIGTFQHRGGFFLKDDLRAFDAPFFSITSKEAAAMDPQQRGILETTYRALENAGLPAEVICGTRTSVHTASFCDDYKSLMAKDAEAFPKHAALGIANSIIANRLSWYFDLKGPSVHMDSACSSSLMALDSACQVLQNGDAEMAIVAGSNLMISPDLIFVLANMNFLSKDSISYSFDERANGYARGEGYGVVILKLLDDAIRDNDTIRAVIRATGSNQDGHTPSFTQPSKDAQEALILDTYKKAGLERNDTRYVEAHGTGTSVGDPIEASAIGESFSAYRSEESPLYVGAVKSNIGHLEGAAGIAGLIKTILILEKGTIPPNVFDRVNPKIDTKTLRIKFPTSPVPWPCPGLRRASVNSFGFGGSNSHVILDDAYHYLSARGLVANHCTVIDPARLSPQHAITNGTSGTNGVNGTNGANGTNGTNGSISSEKKPKLLIWSAADEKSLLRLIKLYEEKFIETQDSINHDTSYLDNLSYTLGLRRTLLPWRSFAVVDSAEDLTTIVRKSSKPIRASNKNKLGFIFTGQGAQYARMGIDLLRYPIFKNSILQSDAYLHEFGCKWSVLDELSADKETSKISQAAYSQPLCTILQIALVDLLRDCGLGKPSAVVGHSSGEVAAAYSIGGLSHKAACKVAYFRGIFSAEVSSTPGTNGAMMAVPLSETDALSYIDKLASKQTKGKISIGCVNSPKSVTITGDAELVDALKELLDHDSISARKLQVNVAYHSSHMNTIAEKYAASIQDLCSDDFLESATMVSSVTRKIVPVQELSKSDYWVRNLISPVRFSEALSQICQESDNKKGRSSENGFAVNNLLEIGPHSTLQGPSKDVLKSVPGGEKVTYASALTRFSSAGNAIAQAVGQLHSLGYNIDFSVINGVSHKSSKSLPDLPEYSFDHSLLYWHETSPSSTGFRLRPHGKLDLLGTTAADWNPLEARWKNLLNITQIPWAPDHKVNGDIIYPAVGMLVMAIEGIRQLAPADRVVVGYTIKDATFSKAVPISADPDESTETQLFIQSSNEGAKSWSKFRLCIWENGRWVETCAGTIRAEYEEAQNEVSANGNTVVSGRPNYTMQKIKDDIVSCTKTLDADKAYKHFALSGIEYGPTFQRLRDIHYNDNRQVAGTIDLFRWLPVENTNHTQPHVVHPASFDALAQLLYLAISNGAENPTPTAVPTRVEKIWISGTGLSYPESSSIEAAGATIDRGFRQIVGSAFASDITTGNVVASIENLEYTTVVAQNALSVSEKDRDNLFFTPKWLPSMFQPVETKIWEYCAEAEPPKPERVAFNESLFAMLHGFIYRALKVVDPSSIASKPSHIQKYYAWMKHAMDEGALEQPDKTRAEWEALLGDDEHHQMLCEIHKYAGEGKFHHIIGENLPQIIAGEVDPLAIFFKDNLVGEYYEHINKVVISYEPVGRYLEVLSHGNPQIKVLEIGAGTGGSTRKVLKSLKQGSQLGYSKFTFTDISPFFFEGAKKQFPEHVSRMEFRTLDIEKDPVEQGFELGTYDVIVAAAVLHATKNLSVTLKNTRSLLKPGGSLILEEVASDDLRTGFAFGLLSGWWLSEEPWRKWGPACSVGNWDKLFGQTGFSPTKLHVRDNEGEKFHNYDWLVSLAEPMPSTDAVEPASEKATDVTIVILDKQPIQQTAAKLLEEQLVSLGDIQCKTVKLQDWMPKTKENGFFISLLEFGAPLISDLTADLFRPLQQLLTHVSNVFWVKGGGNSLESQDDPRYGAIDGFLRALQTENSNLSTVTLWLKNSGTSAADQIKTTIDVFTNRVLKDNLGQELEFVEQDGLLQIGRLMPSIASHQDLLSRSAEKQVKTKSFKDAPPLVLQVGSPGFLDSFYFVHDELVGKPLEPMEIEIEVKAVGVNFRDLLTALGRLDAHKTMGCECAGVVTRVGSKSRFRLGDRVATNRLDTFRTHCRTNDYCTMKLPDDMSYTTGASIPLVFTTAYHSLVEMAHIQAGHTVLIHAGAGGAGGAAIQIAKHFNAEIFTTVGSREKKELLMELYDIPEDHIFYSRNTSFAEEIMRMTNGRGVDIVLNSLSGNSLIASWECIAPYGHFVEIGKADIYAHSDLPMYKFDKNVSFSTVDLAAMMTERPELIQKSFRPVMDLISSGSLQPITPLHLYNMSELEDALRYMQSGTNTGKIVIDLKPDDQVLTYLDTLPAWSFDPNASYLIAGGLGGLGRRIARWFVERGAKHIILLSRTGPRTEDSVKLVEEMEEQGIDLKIPLCDVSNADSLRAAILSCASMPPIKGCIQGSLVLGDSIFDKMTFKDWKTVIDPRVAGSWNLHTLLPKDMDFFLLFSSICGVVGFAAQSNYAASNTYMDALAAYRVEQGQKAVSLDLGWMESSGTLHENEFLRKIVEGAGNAVPIPEEYLLAALDKYCDPALELGTDVQVAFGLTTPADRRAKNADPLPWMARNTFNHFDQVGSQETALAGVQKALDYKLLFQEAKSKEAAVEIVTDALVKKIAAAISKPLEEIDDSKPLHEYGVDSLLAVELRNWFSQVLKADIAVFNIIGSEDFVTLSTLVAERSLYKQSSWTKE